MRPTTANIFQIGTILLTYMFAMALLKFDPTTVGIVSAATLTMWNGVGAVLTSQGAQVQAVIARKDEPAVQTALVQTVSQYKGVEPIVTNASASPALKELAASAAPENAKVEPPK